MVGAYLALLLTKTILCGSPHTESIISKLPGETRTEKLQGLSSSLDDMEEYQAILQGRTIDDAVDDEEDDYDEDDDEDEGYSVVRKAKASLKLLI